MDKKHENAKPNKATALHYDGENAPKVVATGAGSIAEEIVRIAEEHEVFIHEDPILVEVLQQLELGDEIPRQLYLAVAKIIAFAYGLQERSPATE